ncbi:MAG TPA: hypothetical protein VMI93_07665 [Candidatus Solibacter sp.]|nr:hypothetical protein [Candidatus Solibacter sp.]
MKPSKACALLFSLFALSVVVFAGDSWQGKPYSEWNEKEVRQILEKSPWAHRVKLMVVKPPATKIPCPSGNPHCSPDSSPSVPASYPGRRRPASPDDINALQDRRTASAMPPGLDGVAATAVVRWASSRTVREAMLRSGVQRGLVKPEELHPSEALPPVDAFVVYVDLRLALADVKKVPKNGVFTSALVQNSVLVFKSTGERVAPLEVRQAPLPEFDERKELALGAFYVYFPRQKDGKSLLLADESLVRFECPLAPVSISYEFDLHKMTRDGSPDL